MNIFSTDQEKYRFLDMCNSCRYARFSQAQSHIVMMCTVVWEKTTIGIFRVKIVYGKIFTSLGVSEENFQQQIVFKVKFFPVAHKLNKKYINIHNHAKL